jgi:hypothetical protein
VRDVAVAIEVMAENGKCGLLRVAGDAVGRER